MLSLAIVEDERRTLSQIKQMIDWASLGIDSPYTFCNGDAAKEFFSSNKVNIVITDIKLPGISGIDLAEFCHNTSPETKIIMISAFRDFDFIQRSLKFNIVDYITKPIDYDIFVAAIKKATENYKNETLINFCDNILSLNLQKLFSEYFDNNFTVNSEFFDRLGNLGVSVDKENFYSAHIRLHIQNFSTYISNTWKKSKEHLYNAINNMLTFETENFYSFIVRFAYDNIDIIVITKTCVDYGYFLDYVREYISDLQNNILDILKIDTTFEIIEYTNSGTAETQLLSDADYTDIFSYDILQNSGFINDFNTYFNKISYNAGKAQKFIRFIFDKTLLLLDDDEKAIYSDKIDSFEKISDLNNAKESVVDLIGMIRKNRTESKKFIIDQAIAFIDANYSKDISLSDVALHVMVSSNYLSTLFKKCLNENYVDYLTKVRMQRAMILLTKTELTISDITYKIGYNSSNYFMRKFRSYTGLSPSEYRKNAKPK